jgi:hypothetical protein
MICKRLPQVNKLSTKGTKIYSRRFPSFLVRENHRNRKWLKEKIVRKTEVCKTEVLKFCLIFYVVAAAVSPLERFEDRSVSGPMEHQLQYDIIFCTVLWVCSQISSHLSPYRAVFQQFFGTYGKQIISVDKGNNNNNLTRRLIFI